MALAAGTFALPPSMFPLDGPVPPEIEAAGELTLFRSVRLSDPPVPDDGIELRLDEPAAWHRLDLAGSIPPSITTPYLHLGRPLRPWATGVVMSATLAVSLQNS